MTTKTVGTCPACFNTVSLTAKGRVVRHGWKVYGARTVGQYHRSWHSGPCFGVGYLPFEVSAEGTVDYFFKEVVPYGASALKDLAYLSTKPDIRGKVEGTRYSGYGDFEYIIRSGDMTRTRGYWHSINPQTQAHREMMLVFDRVPEYTAALDQRVKRTEANLANLIACGHDLCERVAAWQPAEVQVKKTVVKETVYHARSERIHHFTVCGYRTVALMGGRTLKHIAHRPGDVNCPDCIAKLAAKAS